MMLRSKYKYLYKIYYDYNISRAMHFSQFGVTDIDMCPDDDDFSGPEIVQRLPTYREHKWAVKETNQIIRFAIVNNFNR